MKRLSDRQQSQRPSSSPKVIEKFNSDPPSYGSEQTPKPHPPNSRGKALPQHSALQPSQNTPPNTHRGLLPSPPAHPSKIINITTLPTQYGAPPRSQDAPPAPQWYDPHGATRAALGTAPSPAAPHLPKHAGRTAPTAPNRYSPLHMVRRVPHPHPDGLALAHPAGAPFPSRWFSPQFLSGSVPALRCAPPGAASVVRPAAPAPGPSGVVRPPPRSRPHSVPEGGARGRRSPPGGHWWYGPAPHGGGSGRNHRGGRRSGTRAGALTCHRRPPSLSGGALLPPIATLRLVPLLVFPGGSKCSGSGNAFSEPGPTARAARPPPAPSPQPPLTAPSHPLAGNTAFSRHKQELT